MKHILIQGPQGSGKSTIANAIWLAQNEEAVVGILTNDRKVIIMNGGVGHRVEFCECGIYDLIIAEGVKNEEDLHLTRKCLENFHITAVVYSCQFKVQQIDGYYNINLFR